VIGQPNAQAALQPVKILRFALRSCWARVGIFLDDLEKRQLLSLPRIELWSLGRLDLIVIIVPTEPFRLQLIIYYIVTLLSNFLSYFYSPFFLLPSYEHFSFFRTIFSSVFLSLSYIFSYLFVSFI
jgi:hypothetical protein